MSDLTFKRIAKAVAYFGTLIIALALLLQLIFQTNGAFVGAMRLVGEIIAYVITMVFAFGFVRTKRSPVWAILYAVAVTAIVVLLIFR